MNLTPPRRHTEDGRERRVGVELEFGGLDAAGAAALVALHCGDGEPQPHGPHRYVVPSRLGEFVVELDTRFAHPAETDEAANAEGFIPTLKRVVASIDEFASDVAGRVGQLLVPTEVVTPPLPWTELALIDNLAAALRKAGAEGSAASAAYGFGLHLNPEVASTDTPYLLAHLRAYLLLSDWLRRDIHLDTTRRVLPHADPFPVEYSRLVLEPGYKPSTRRLVDDYLLHNPTRNRELDLLPLFCHLEEKRVRKALDDERIKPRPTFHYRLPDMALEKPDWRPTQEWQRWLEVERLAADDRRLGMLSDAFLLYAPIGNGEDWLRRSRMFRDDWRRGAFAVTHPRPRRVAGRHRQPRIRLPVNTGTEQFRQQFLPDLWAGLTAGAVLLPQAMAFGAALYAPLGLSAASGALAGLVGAACLCLMSGLIGRTHGLVSAPTGPALVLLGGALAAASAAGVANDQLPAALAVLTVTAGVLQLALGASGGGRLIKFIPYPVVAGFMTGAGLLMILSQIEPASGVSNQTPWSSHGWIPLLTTAVTFLTCQATSRLLPAVPATVAGLLIGTLMFHALLSFAPGTVPASWVVGELPGPESLHFALDVSLVPDLPWMALLPSALALALLTSLNTLLAAVIADTNTGARHDSRRELMAQGLGQISTGALGGMTGSATTGATVLASSTGGGRWCSTVVGLGFVFLVLAGGPVGTLLPMSALAGIIIHVAIGVLELDVLAWARRRRTRLDAAVALLVATVTVAWNLVAAVAVGVVIAIILFIRAQVMAAVVHRRSTGEQMRSVRVRSWEQRRLLDEHGARIVVYELRGNLFFATAERLLQNLLPDIERPIWLILNLRRVTQVDLTGIKLLDQVAARVDAAGGHLLFCDVHSGAGMGRKVKKTLRKTSPSGARYPVQTFIGMDEALEHAEDALLAELGCAPATERAHASLRDIDLCSAMSEQEVATLADALETRQLSTGENLFRAGQHGSELFIVVDGELEVSVRVGKRHHKRLAIYGPGTAFGGVAFMQPGARAADAIATRDCELLVLSRERFTVLAAHHPDVAVDLLFALGHQQAEYLRWSAREIRRLAEW